MPLVSVVITTHNERKTIVRCINSIFEQSYSNFEIIVVDSKSTDDTQELLNNLKSSLVKFPNCKRYELISAEAPTPASGRNLGVSYSRGEIIAFTDADCIAERQWILNLVNTMNPKTDLVAGPNIVCHEKTSKSLKIMDEVLKNSIATAGSLQFVEIKVVTEVTRSVPACNMAVSRPLFIDIGGFNSLLRYNEDTDFCERFREGGYKIIFTPNAKVKHYIGIDSIRQLVNFIWNYGSGRGTNIPKYHKLLSKFLIFSLSVFMLLPAMIVCSLISSDFRIPLLITLIILGAPILLLSFKIGLNFKDIVAIPIALYVLLIIFFTYNAGLISGLIKSLNSK